MKKSINIIILFAFISSFIISCSDDDPVEPDTQYQYPVSAFSYTGNDGPAPVTVQFYNHCVTILADSATYRWTFGNNGPQSELKEPSFTFTNPTNKPQSYLVTLTVTDLISNLSQTRSQSIEIDGGAK